MRKDLLPYYLQNLTIRGFEDDDEGDDKDDKSKSKTGDDDDDDDGGDDGGDKNKPEDNTALKTALQKERQERKRLAREHRAMQARLDEIDSKDKSDTDKAKEEATKAQQKAERLATRLKDSAVDNALIKVSGQLKFRDPDDALKLVDRSKIVVDQDDEDPSIVDLDEDSVVSALKALAKAKPHLLVAEGQEDKSGSKFGGGRKSSKEADEEALRAKYPALARSAHSS